ncbi:ribonuclease H [Trifolium pratense]|uniref:Ribonuclease H n=1 Tax=Trifolium pratense TaxID=57577 RepID=A0A2K3LQ75_TRIPR|nr:ribonuclease H [Trifolium pratense]
MGFSSQSVKWIMMCVDTVDYSIIANDETVGPIILARGLRQGDRCHHICSLFVQKAFQRQSDRQKNAEKSLAPEYAEYLIYL